jgi:hypothetical protein
MAGWPAKGGTLAISRRSTHRSVIALIYLTLAQPQCCGQRLSRQNFATFRKNISQSFGSAGDFSQGLASFDRIMLDPKG